MSLAEKFAARLASYEVPELDPNYNFFVYGPTGAGKTTLAKTLKADAVEHGGRVLLLNNDRGDKSILSAIHDTDPYRWLINEHVNGYKDLQAAYAYLASADHDFRWVMLDDCTIMAGMLYEVLEKDFPNDVWTQYRELDKRFRKMLRLFRDLDIQTLFIAREGHKEGQKEKKTAAFPGKALGAGNDKSSVLHEFDNAFRMTREHVQDGKDQYMLQTSSSPTAEAKNRCEGDGLRFMEPADISAIRAKMVQSTKNSIKGE